ncbi:MAG: hypothetical protein V3U76_15130 [Granulosicoccus sp.]
MDLLSYRTSLVAAVVFLVIGCNGSSSSISDVSEPTTDEIDVQIDWGVTRL